MEKEPSESENLDQPTELNNPLQNTANSKESYASISPTFAYQEEENRSYEAFAECHSYKKQITISEDSQNQIVTVVIEPKDSLWFQGEVIASNRPFRPSDEEMIQGLLKLIKKVKNFSKLYNDAQEIAYYCIRKKHGGGKILYLDVEIYEEQFLVDYNNVILLNINPKECQFSVPNIMLPNLEKTTPKDKNKKISFAIQSRSGDMIFEKSLGTGERFYVGNSHILAISETIWVHKNEKEVFLEGPGIVFLEPGSQNAKKSTNIILLFSIRLFIAFFFIAFMVLSDL